MSADLPHILVVDDDLRLRKLLHKYLSENGFVASTAADARDARTKLASLTFDLIILDLMMPGESGLHFAKDLRQSSSIPILMLTAMGEAEDRIAGLEHGADDYLVKPFEPRELLLRIHAILRRVPDRAAAVREVRMGPATFNMDRMELVKNGAVVRLTSVEASLLQALAETPGAVLSRDDLSQRTGPEADTSRAVDVQVARLRRKIEDDPRVPRYLQTVRGKGYVLRPD